jgi:hypothetical protein
MNAERHLLKEALVHVPFLGITLVHVVCYYLDLRDSDFYNACNLPGVCGPCVLRREKLVSFYHLLIEFIFFSSHTFLCAHARVCTHTSAIVHENTLLVYALFVRTSHITNTIIG